MNIVLLGAQGKLGRKIAQLCPDSGMEWCMLGRSELESFPVFLDFMTRQTKPFLILDVSLPQATTTLVQYLLETKSADHPALKNLCGLIVGTTGHDEHTRSLFSLLGEKVAVCVVSNFSKGIFALEQILQAQTPSGISVQELLTQLGFQTNLTEIHHVHKKDAPSGTALTLAEKIKFPKELITSHRQGEVVGTHTIEFSCADEDLSITHKAHSRDLFARGALFLCRRFFEKNPGRGLFQKDFFFQ